jgi:hypothetical protein
MAADEGGVVGHHPPADPFEFLVAPTTASEFNTARLRLIPVACWRIEDIRFAFDSSFPTPEIAGEIQALFDLRDEHKQLDPSTRKTQFPPLSMFGHADPVGTDAYNKALSGRRVMAIYAVLIVNTSPDMAVGFWRQISVTENWGANQRQAMRDNVPAGTSDSDLFKAYMQTLCPASVQLSPKDFLGQGADPKGKGDYQGCSEFNPRLIFSKEKEAEFAQASDKTARNTANAPNRRVMALLFRPGSRIDPNKWPCPRATEPLDGCVKRFWSDNKARRGTHLPGADRQFDDNHDTFACRFYQRISDSSPCEQLPDPPILCHFSYILHADLDDSPVANEAFQIDIGGGNQMAGKTDADGALDAGDVPPGDYPMKIAGLTITVPALNKAEIHRPLRVRPDISTP